MKVVVLTVLSIVPALMPGQTPASAALDTSSDTSAAPIQAPLADSGLLTPLTREQKIRRRASRLIEPVTLVSAAFSAGIDQWRDVPHSWGQGTEGYAIRFASAEGFTAAHNGVALGFDLAFHLDPRYRREPGAPMKSRMWNAISQSFIAETDSGHKTVNVSEIAGNLGAGFISNTWQPAGYNSPSDGLIRGLLGIAFHTGKNVAREFLPDLLHRGQRSAPLPDPTAAPAPHS